MNRNPKDRHLKRVAAPRTWMLDKLSGVWAPRPSAGPHKLRECLPIILILRERLKYALTAREVKLIVAARHIRVDSKVRTDTRYPCGFQDVVTINRTGEHFRLIYDVKGRFFLHRVPVSEANWKLCKVVKKALGARGIPYIVTHDGRTLSYPDPEINVGDTIKYDFIENKILQHAPFKTGSVVMVTGGRNIGRVGILHDVERHPGSFDIVHIKDRRDKTFATRKDNIFILGKGAKEWISLPKTKGVKYTPIEERDQRLEKQKNQPQNLNNKKKVTGGTLLPKRVAELRKQSREKRELLKLIDTGDKKTKKKGAAGKKKGSSKKADK